MDVTVDFVANILRLGLSFVFISSNISGRVVDLTANARRFVGGDDKSSFGAIGCGCIGSGGGGGGSSFVVCKINCCCVDPCVRTVYCVPPGDVHKVATCCC